VNFLALNLALKSWAYYRVIFCHTSGEFFSLGIMGIFYTGKTCHKFCNKSSLKIMGILHTGYYFAINLVKFFSLEIMGILKGYILP
jgi:hypothetical protein